MFYDIYAICCIMWCLAVISILPILSKLFEIMLLKILKLILKSSFGFVNHSNAVFESNQIAGNSIEIKLLIKNVVGVRDIVV